MPSEPIRYLPVFGPSSGDKTRNGIGFQNQRGNHQANNGWCKLANQLDIMEDSKGEIVAISKKYEEKKEKKEEPKKN